MVRNLLLILLLFSRQLYASETSQEIVTDISQVNAIMNHIETAPWMELKSEIASGSLDVNMKLSNGSSLLWQAIKLKRKKALHRLLRCDVDVNRIHPNNATLLMLACSLGDEQTVASLLSKNADVNAVDYYGYNALYFAKRDDSNGQNGAIIDLLVDYGINDVYSRDIFSRPTFGN